MPGGAPAADKLVALYSAHAVPYSMPWVAEELGLFKKQDIDFDFVYIPSSSTATAAILGGNVEIGLLGGVGIVNAFVSGATDLAFIGSIKNIMTQSILAKPEITRLEQLRGKRIGVTRIGSNTHYFTVQAFRRAGMNTDKDIIVHPDRRRSGNRRRADGGPDRCRDVVAAERRQGAGAGLSLCRVRSGYWNSLRRLDHCDPSLPHGQARPGDRPIHARDGRSFKSDAPRSRNWSIRVMEKQLRIKDRAVLEASYAIEMKVMEPRLEMKAPAIQPMIEEVARTNPRANEIKPQDMMDRRYLAEMESSGFFQSALEKIICECYFGLISPSKSIARQSRNEK